MAKSKLRGRSLLLTLAIGVALACCRQASAAPQTTSQLASGQDASTTTLASVGAAAVTSPRGVKRASQQVINSNGVVASESTTPRAKNFDALMAGRPFYSIKDGKTSARRIQQQQPQVSLPIASSRQQQQQKNDEEQNRLLTELMDNLQSTGGTSESPSMSTTGTSEQQVDTNGQQLANQQVSQQAATPADSSGIGSMMLIDSFNQLVASSDAGQQLTGSPTPSSNNNAAAADSTGEPNESSTGSGSPAVSSLSMSLDGMIVNSRPRGGQTKSPASDDDMNQVAVAQQSSGATQRIGQQSPEGQSDGAPPTTSRNGKPAGSSRRVPFTGQPFSSPASKGQRTRPKASNNQTPRQQQQQTGSGDNAPSQQEQQQQQQQQQQMSTTQVPAGFADEQSANNMMMEQVNLIGGGGGANQFNQSSASNNQLIETQRPLATKLANGDMLMSVVSSDDGKERRLVMISRDTLDSLQRFAASAAAAQQRQQLQQQQQQQPQQLPPQQSKTSGKAPPPQSGGFVGGPSNSWWPSSTTMTSSPARQSFNQQDEQTATTTTTTTGSSLDQTTTTSTPTPQTVNFVTAVAGQMAPRSTPGSSSSSGSRLTGSGEPTTTTTSATTKRITGSDQISTTTLAPSTGSSSADESNTSTTQQSSTTNEDNTFREVAKPEVRSKVTGRGGKQSGTKMAVTSKAQKSSVKSASMKQNSAKQNNANKQQAVGKSSSAAITQQRNNSMQRNGSSRGNQTLATGTTKQQAARQKSGQSGKQSSTSSASKRNKSANSSKNTSSPTAPPPTPSTTTTATSATTTTTVSPLITTTTTSSSHADKPTSPATPMSRRELDRQLDELERGLSGAAGDGSDSSTGSGGSAQDSAPEMRQPAQFEPNSERVQSELDGLRAAIPGEPLIDYPIYSQPPTRARSFQCQAQSCPGGYYADLEAQCQVFHVCQNDGRMDTFLCPNGTIFSQQHFVCVWWWQVDCAQATKFYRLNDAIYCNSMTLPASVSSQSGDFNQRNSNQLGGVESSSTASGTNQRDELSTTQSSSGTTDQSSGSTAPAANGAQSNTESDLNQQQQLELLARRAA